LASGMGRKASAIILATIMFLSVFCGLTSLASESSEQSPDIENTSPNEIKDIRTVIWKEDFEGYQPGEQIFPPSDYVIAAVPPPGQPSGTIYPGLNTGTVCAHHEDSSGGSYWGYTDINESYTTSAFLGGWICMASVTRYDLILYDLNAGCTMIEVALQNDGTLRHWPGGAYTQIPGITWALNTWYELWVEYNEVSQTYSVWWNGVEYAQGSPMISGGVNVDSMIWFGTSGTGTNVYIDNCYHWNLDLSPVADAGLNQTHPQHTLVAFDGSDSYDDKGITTYIWEFNDSGPVVLSGISPSYMFNNAGVYNVTLTVTDTCGQTDTDYLIITITDTPPPVADAGSDQTQPKYELVYFDGSGSDDENGITNYWWNFTDGGPVTLTGETPSYVFNNLGIFIVTLTVMDASGETGSDDMAVTIIEIFDIDIADAAQSNGWILMSFPNNISGHPFSIIEDFYGDTDWDIIRGWDAQNQRWITSAKFWPPSLNTFNYVDNTIGFWLHITSYGDGLLTMEGPLPESGELITMTTLAGWNLIGWPGNPTRMIDFISMEAPSWTSVWIYESGDEYQIREADIYNEYFQPGYAYWICGLYDELVYIWIP
jgi:PKD repeat protein